MFKNTSIRSKLTSIILFLVVVTIIAAGYISYSIRKSFLQENYLRNLNALAEVKIKNIKSFISSTESDISLISNLEVIKNNISGLEANQNESMLVDSFADDTQEEDSTSSSEAGGELDLFGFGDMGGFEMDNTVEETVPQQDEKELVKNALINVKGSMLASEIIITNVKGEILVNTNSGSSATNIRQVISAVDDSAIEGAKAGTYYGNIYKVNESYFIPVGSPINVGSTVRICYVIYNLNGLFEMLEEDMGFGETVETVLAQHRKGMTMVLNPLKFNSHAALNITVNDNDERGTAIQNATTGNDGKGYSVDYRNVKTLSVWKYIKETNWGLEVKVDQSEINGLAFVIIKKFSIWGAIILVFTILISILLSQFFISPLLSLKDALGSVSKGILPDRVEKKYDDEVGQMAETTDDLVQALKRTATFAEKIGKGDLQADFKPLSKGDILGNALIDMRKSLQDTEKRDTERNWIVIGVAEISDILRSHDTIDRLGDAVISYISEKINAIQGALYVVNDENENDMFIEMNSTYAYHKKKYIKAKFKFAEGLVGQAAAEKDTILRTEIPDDYVSITSGLLGEQKPSCILITPLMTEEKVFGVLEFAGFQRFSEMQVKFVEEISLILARTIFNIKVNERTRNLLEESQKMSNELQQQQEVLQQNAEEMAATQEELKRTNQRLEDQIEEVNRTQNRMQLLLENASEVIAIYEEEGTIRYISPSVEKILGYPPNEMIGITDRNYVEAEGLESFDMMFKQVIENPFESVTVQYEYIKKNGEAVWLEATANNMLADPAIQGIIINSRDITERRRAEREERMRSKMQALSENSLDIITRLTQNGEVFYINPMIETYTGHRPGDFVNRTLEEVSLDELIKGEWLNLLKEVEAQNDKITKEMDFPSIIGNRVMQINAIPEYDEEQKMESVLMVSHDITERKQIELEIQSTNRKITESINYAKRIQGAILPNNAIIRQILPDSFILYKARDVVSGDFPWFMPIGNTIFFAAVDCTGHGVPGALISLIGYFLLNDIVKGRKISDPGLILDNLDKGVTKTLRQDNDNASTKDGMDIALCRIDLDKKEVSYAGAHRSLYYVQDNELKEIKGNKFPIGGGIYRNQTQFTSTTFKVKKGDSMFFCSDGFTDQFGGPENRKFGPKKLRDLISENHKKSMAELYKLFDDSWSDWKGDQKQTDDVLLIGVRF